MSTVAIYARWAEGTLMLSPEPIASADLMVEVSLDLEPRARLLVALVLREIANVLMGAPSPRTPALFEALNKVINGGE
jgi:hypothetical protein